MSSLNHGRYKMHRTDMGTRAAPSIHKASLLAYAMRPGNNLNPYTGRTHFIGEVLYRAYGRGPNGPIGLRRVYRMARARHLSATCGLGCWPMLLAGPIGFLP